MHSLCCYTMSLFIAMAVRVGRTTSGGRGFRTGLTLCLGYVRCEPETPKSELMPRVITKSVLLENGLTFAPLKRPAV